MFSAPTEAPGYLVDGLDCFSHIRIQFVKRCEKCQVYAYGVLMLQAFQHLPASGATITGKKVPGAVWCLCSSAFSE